MRSSSASVGSCQGKSSSTCGSAVGGVVPGVACARSMPRRPATNPFNQARCDSDRKSTRLNSSHLVISYAVFCLKKKNKMIIVDVDILLRIERLALTFLGVDALLLG